LIHAAVEFGQHGKLRRSQPGRHERGIIELRMRRDALRSAVQLQRFGSMNEGSSLPMGAPDIGISRFRIAGNIPPL
jgi:hypothetical protein